MVARTEIDDIDENDIPTLNLDSVREKRTLIRALTASIEGC